MIISYWKTHFQIGQKIYVKKVQNKKDKKYEKRKEVETNQKQERGATKN